MSIIEIVFCMTMINENDLPEVVHRRTIELSTVSLASKVKFVTPVYKLESIGVHDAFSAFELTAEPETIFGPCGTVK